jgi:hydroxymethylpyrimidine pyrophosphatase-like HAD family hydrolase
MICTGRGLVECEQILAAIEQRETVAVAGGAILADPLSRRTLHRFAIDQRLVHAATEVLLRHEMPVMVLKDPLAAGYDYLIVMGEAGHAVDPVTAWWFTQMNVRVKYVRSIDEDPHPEHTVRVGVCARASRLGRVQDDLQGVFQGRALLHHFPAVVAPEHAARFGADSADKIHILEVFDKDANKWSAILWRAAELGIDPRRVCAIGDEINDLTMIRGAGLGIAMGNAVPVVLEAAGRRTGSNREDGVAMAVRKVLDGEW